MNDWKSVFDSYPDAQQIFVVDGMPFLESRHAQGHARATGKPMEVVARPVEVPDVSLADQEAAANNAAADKVVTPKAKGRAKKA